MDKYQKIIKENITNFKMETSITLDSIEENSEENTEENNTYPYEKQFIIFCIIIITYCLGISLIELVYSIKVLNLISEYNKYIKIIDNQIVNINDFPGNIFFQINQAAAIYISISLLSIIINILNFTIIKCKAVKKLAGFYFGLLISCTFNGCLTLLQSAYTYVKLSDLNYEIKDFWNNVDARFIEYLEYTEIFIYLSAVPTFIGLVSCLLSPLCVRTFERYR